MGLLLFGNILTVSIVLALLILKHYKKDYSMYCHKILFHTHIFFSSYLHKAAQKAIPLNPIYKNR